MAFSLFKKKKNSKDDRYQTLKVREVVHVAKDAVNLVFEKPESFEYEPGQFITLIKEVNGKKIRRAYSLCTTPFEDEHPAVTVKRVDGGSMSNDLNDNAKAGDEIEVMEPMGMFTTTYKSENTRNAVFFGGGSGITPLMSIAKSALDQEPDTVVSLIYCNQNMESVIFREQLEEMILSSLERFHLVHVLEKPSDMVESYEGWLTEDIIKDALAKLPQRPAAQTEYFTCGPAPMMDVVENSLKGLGIDLANFHKESFVAATDTKEEAPEEVSEEIIAREVTVIYDDEEYKYVVEPGETILEKGLDQDIDLPFSCQSGLCTACRGKCVSGKVKMDEEEGLSEAEIDEGYVLPCVGHPLTEDVVIEIG